jgi:8-amino-3,8-dideoxy-alpha-D-manno-octulosonate transaminase
MQGVVGKVQLGKLDRILAENKSRFEALSMALGGKFSMRQIPGECEPIYDTLIFFVENQDLRVKIIALLNETRFGTKNLPDAIEWHCAAYWDHALNDRQIQRVQPTKEKLLTAVAVPIWLKKTIDEYKELGEQLRGLIK